MVKPSHLARNCGYSSLMLPATCMGWPTQEKRPLCPICGAERSFLYIEGRGSGFGKYLGHDPPAVRTLLQGVEVHINGTYRRESVLPTAKRRNL